MARIPPLAAPAVETTPTQVRSPPPRAAPPSLRRETSCLRSRDFNRRGPRHHSNCNARPAPRTGTNSPGRDDDFSFPALPQHSACPVCALPAAPMPMPSPPHPATRICCWARAGIALRSCGDSSRRRPHARLLLPRSTSASLLAVRPGSPVTRPRLTTPLLPRANTNLRRRPALPTPSRSGAPAAPPRGGSGCTPPSR